jgi:hypothetical protein
LWCSERLIVDFAVVLIGAGVVGRAIVRGVLGSLGGKGR